LLKLKRVEIHGFKSFYDRTEMKFNGSGIAAVVGPNGCGKSNLSDAISWVLGEQSAKTLRGSRMEDVIFAGTREKKPLGMASVTMTLVPDERLLEALHLNGINGVSAKKPEHSNGHRAAPTDPTYATQDLGTGDEKTEVAQGDTASKQGPIVPEVVKSAERAGEITITRRLYRSGDSEYLINGKSARLRDIQDLFLGTGLGPESYAIIEQGRIGQILSNKPQDRRAVIEEAAGITRFKTKKRLAEAKLESAKQNLSRVFDILEEVNRQVNSLKRQAAKTKRYAELKTESTGFLRQLLASRYSAFEREGAKLAIELNFASAELRSAQDAVAQSETEHGSVLDKSYAVDQELGAAAKSLSELKVQAERVRGTLEHQLKQLPQIEARLRGGEHETESLRKQQSAMAAEIEQQTTNLTDLESQLSADKRRLEEKATERSHAQQNLAERERELESTRQIVLRLLGECSSLKNRLTQTEAQLASSERDAARAQAEERQSESDSQRVQKLRAELSELLTARQTQLISVTDQRRAVDDELQKTRERLNDTRQSVDRLRSEHSRIKARRDSLDEVIQHRSYTTETVKRLFTAVEKGKVEAFSPLGVLADFLEVDAQIEKAAEEFLHDELEYVVVQSRSEAERGIELMRNEFNGRATFLAETAAAQEHDAVPLPAPNPEEARPVAELLKLTNGLADLPLKQLPRIAYSYVTDTREKASSLAGQFPHCWFLTLDGVSYHGHAVSGGKKTGAGPLALKRELRELKQVEEDKQRELNAGQNEAVLLERALARLVDQQEQLRTQQQSQEKDLLALDHESLKLSEELQRANSRLSHARLELDRIAHDRVKLNETIERDRAQLAEREAARGEAEQSLETARASLGDLQAAAAHAAEEHSALRASLASLDERRRALFAARERTEHQIRSLANRQAQLTHESARLTAEREQLLTSNTELENEQARLSETVNVSEARTRELSIASAELRSRIGEVDDHLKHLRQKVQEVQESRSGIQVALARLESDLKHLEETCQKELGCAVADLLKQPGVLTETVDLADLEAKYAEVTRKIEALGPVNPQALEEFDEAQQRQEFLNAQRQDLLDSIRDTERTIGEIDTESRKRFGEAFEAINANFREMFNVLFGGGTGEMRLTDEENLGESGIDIVASPPGKRLQSVLLLSGGEKSLTAMALLMAIFQYTPSPFCVLDEVDAPLDDPNIERLTRLLRDMAQQTQFIVITHSKRTMESAQALYGVTMQEPGVSKLVSVRFAAEQESVTDEHSRVVETAMA
jgi:chromosome segregation protein